MGLLAKIKNFLWVHSADYRSRVLGERVYDIAKPFKADSIIQPPMDPQTAVNELCRYFMGRDYYIINPLNSQQANTQIVWDIMVKYKGDKRYYKELKDKYGAVQKRKE